MFYRVSLVLLTGTILGSVSSPALLEASGNPSGRSGYFNNYDKGKSQRSNDRRDFSHKNNSYDQSNSRGKYEERSHGRGDDYRSSEEKGNSRDTKKKGNYSNPQEKRERGFGASNNSQPSQDKIGLKKIDFTKSLRKRPEFRDLFNIPDSYQGVVEWCNTIRDIMKDKNHRDYNRNVNTIFIARVLTSLGQAVKKNPKLKSVLDEYFRAQTEFLDLWEDLVGIFLEQNKFNEQGLSNIFYGNVQLGGILGSNFLAKWETQALSRIKAFNEQGLSNIFYGNAQLGGKLSSDFLAKWETQALSRIKAFNEQELSNIFYGNALLGGELNKEFLTKWETQALSRFKAFNEQELSNIFYGNVLLGGILGSNFLKKWEEEATNHLKSFNEQHLSNIFYGNAQLGRKLSRDFLAKWETQALSRLNEFKEQELSNIFYGNAQLGGKLNKEFLTKWETQALSRLKAFNEQELSNIFYGNALLGGKWSDNFLKTWETQALSRLNEFKEQHLSNIFYGNAQLGGKVNKEFLTKWETQALSRLTEFNEQHLSNIFYGNAQLGGKLSRDFLAKWETEALSRLTQFNEQGLSNIFYGNAQLGGILGSNFLAKWETQALSRLNEFKEHGLSNIFYGQALLGNPFSQKFLGAWKETFLSKRTNGEFQDPSAEIHSIYLAIQRFNLQKEFAEDLFQEIKLLSKKHGKKNKITTSQLQNSVFESLQFYSKDKDLGDLEKEAFFESVMSPVDIYLKKYGIVVEVQGPSHFLSDQKTAKPEDRLKEHILLNDSEGKVCSVLAIPYFEWNSLKNEQEKVDYFNKKLFPIVQELNLRSPHQETLKDSDNLKSSAMNIVLNLGEGKDLNERNLRIPYKKRKFPFSNDGFDKDTVPGAYESSENKESEIRLPFKKRLLPQLSGEIDFSNGAES